MLLLSISGTNLNSAASEIAGQSPSSSPSGPKAVVGQVGYGSLKAAYDAAQPDAVIMLLESELAEDLLIRDKDVVLKGGYAADFRTRGGSTVLKGKVAIAGGSLRADRVILRRNDIDVSAPTAPASLSAAPTPTGIGLTWSPSIDNVGVTGYEVWRNEARLATTTGTSYNDAALSPGIPFTYHIRAFDSAGNLSPASTGVNASASAGSMAGVSLTPANPVAGEYVRASFTPGIAAFSGTVHVFDRYQINGQSGAPTGVPIRRFELCPSGECTAAFVVEMQIPSHWPAGSYYFCGMAPSVSCKQVEIGNPSPVPDQGICSAVSLEGPSEEKYDVVLVADKFGPGDMGIFRARVEEYRAALLAVPPFSENRSKFNFWKVERVGPLLIDQSYDIPYDDYWLNQLTRCGGVDLVAVVEGPSVPALPFAMGGQAPPWLMVTSDYGGTTFVHEFGHAFVLLGDEYTNTRLYLSDPALDLRVNKDVAFCPKWCSGEPNREATLPGLPGFSCWSAWETFNDCIARLAPGPYEEDAVEACWSGAADLKNGWSAAIDRCDFGTGCRPGTGCFWNAKATNLFRSDDFSIMSGGEIATGFNPPSLDAILRKLETIK